MKYNTVRSILESYYQNGRINVKKKRTGYKKNKSRHITAALKKKQKLLKQQKAAKADPKRKKRHYRHAFL